MSDGINDSDPDRREHVRRAARAWVLPERWTAKQWACVVAAIAGLEGEPALSRSRRVTPRSVAVMAGCSDQTARLVLRRLRAIGLLGRYHYNGPWAEHYFPVRATKRVK